MAKPPADAKTRALKQHGWPAESVVVIDSDLGLSGADSDREGFQRLVAEVGMGRAGPGRDRARARSVPAREELRRLASAA